MQAGHENAFLWTVDVGINSLFHLKNGMNRIYHHWLLLISGITGCKTYCQC